MLQNRIYRGEIVDNKQSYLGEHEPIIDHPLWDAVQARLASNAAQHNDGGKTRPPSLLVGMLFDGDGNRMTPAMPSSEPDPNSKTIQSLSRPHHRRCGTGI